MTSDPRPVSRERQALQGMATRAKLIRAAEQELRVHGQDGFRVVRVAKAAGTTTGALYAHFGSREGLILATYAESMFEFSEQISVLRQQTAVDDGETPTMNPAYRDAVYAAFSQEGLAMRRHWAEAALAAHLEGHASDEIKDAVRASINRFAAEIQRSQSRGHMRPDVDPKVTSLFFFALVEGLSVLTEVYDDSPETYREVARTWFMFDSLFDSIERPLTTEPRVAEPAGD